MNRAAHRLAQRQHRMSMAAVIATGILLLASISLAAWEIVNAIMHIPPGWWLPPENRPFGGRL